MSTPPPAELPHSIKRSRLTGAVTVHFACPACKAGINSPVDDAGNTDKCPDCGTDFRVPGMEARRAEDVRRKAKQAEQRAAEERAQQQRKEEAAWAAAARTRIAATRADRARRPRPYTAGCCVTGYIMAIAGAGLLVFGIFMSTTVSGVNNIGLLNDRIVLVIVGSVLVLSGIILRAVSALGDEVHRWGRKLMGKPRENSPTKVHEETSPTE